MKYAPFLSLLGGSLLLAQGAHAATLIQYNFDQQLSATQYADQSGNGRTVTFNDTVGVNANYPFSTSHPELEHYDRSARTAYNKAISGSVSGISTINLATTGQFTMEGWVYLEGFSNYGSPASDKAGTIWSVASSDGGASRFALRYSTDGTVQATYNVKSQSGGTRTYDTGVQLELGVWTHLAYVKTGTQVIVYVNGVGHTFSESGITSRLLPATLSSISVGLDIYGRFDDFRFSDVALAPANLGYYTPFTAVPEPSGVAMLLFTGALGGGFLARRRSKKLNAA